MKRVLVTGALGQLGSELVPALKRHPRVDKVVASDVPLGPISELLRPFEFVDCTAEYSVRKAVRAHRIDTIIHLAGVLSRVAEEDPQLAWETNIAGLYRVLEVARGEGCSLFFPSSTGAFGPSTPRHQTPQNTVQQPTTIFGIGKVYGELLCDYYHRRFGVDTRGVRFPGIVSYAVMPSGGVTDFAVELLDSASRNVPYVCPLGPDTRMDMMYIPDAIKATVSLMEADPLRLQHRNSFNVAAMSITPRELAEEVRTQVPDFHIEYKPDPLTQAIAESWPEEADDTAARAEWDWEPEYGLEAMTRDMLGRLRAQPLTRRDLGLMRGRPRIFLCHAKEDDERVFRLFERLRNSGFDPWYDREKLDIGDRWEEVIISAIRESDFFVVCLSTDAVAKSGFINREIRTAIAEFQQRQFDSPYLLPIRMDDCEVPDLRIDVNTTLRSIQHFDLFGGDEAALDRFVHGVWRQWHRGRSRRSAEAS